VAVIVVLLLSMSVFVSLPIGAAGSQERAGTPESTAVDVGFGSSDWPVVQHDVQHTGCVVDEPSFHLPLVVDREFTVQGGYIDSISYGESALFASAMDGKSAANSNVAYAIDPNSGEILWNFTLETGTGSMSCTPAISDGMVFFGGQGDNKLYAVNASTGEKIWDFAGVGTMYSANPVVYEGIVYAKGDGKLFALNETDGSKVWDFSLDGYLGRNTPAIYDGIVYIGSGYEDTGGLYALNATSGEKVWNSTGAARVFSIPVISEGLVFVDSNSSMVKALNLASGTLKWDFSFPLDYNGTIPMLSTGAFAYPGTMLYVSSWTGATGKGRIYAVDGLSGAESWHFEMEGLGAGTPVVVNGIVYVLCFGNGKLYALDAYSGGLIWSSVIKPGKSFNTLIMAHGTLYAAGQDTVCALKPVHGKRIVRVAFCPSWGRSQDPSLLYRDIANQWFRLGDCEIQFIDVYSPVTYEKLASTEADAVVICDPAGGNRQYSASEADAIQNYLITGNKGLFISYALNYGSFNDAVLARLVGVNGTLLANTSSLHGNTFDLLEPSHPLFLNISNPWYSNGYYDSQALNGSSWSEAVKSGEARILARTTDSLAYVIAFDNLIWRSVWATSMPDYHGNDEDMQFIYNSIIWLSSTRTNPVDTSKVYGAQLLWSNPMAVNDFAVSKDGRYIVAVNDTGLYYFETNSSIPKWWYLSQNATLSVSISADGEYVATGDVDGYLSYFDQASASIGLRGSGTWQSKRLFGAGPTGGQIQKGTLDMSDSGEYVVVGGTGDKVYYFANCKMRSGINQDTTWERWSVIREVHCVDMSSDGRFIIAGGPDYTLPVSRGRVEFYKDADTAPAILWTSGNSAYPVEKVTVSDDGFTVCAISSLVEDHLYCWTNASNLSGIPNATWTADGPLLSVDASLNGDETIGGMGMPSPCGLHYWDSSRVRSGSAQAEDWVKFEGSIVWGAAISNDGALISASVTNETEFSNKAVFLRSDGNVIAEFDMPQINPFVSMSGDGRVTAMGGNAIDSLHVFRIQEDLTAPTISDVYQQPVNGSVTPNDEVIVYANVTDLESGVGSVLLNYTNGNGTWTTTSMVNLGGTVWNGTVPKFDLLTWVNYTITAQDLVGNVATTEQELGYSYQYQVIPEHSLTLVAAFLIVTSLAVATTRRAKMRNRKLRKNPQRSQSQLFRLS